MIASDEIGVVVSRSSVCFSRSRLMAPAVEAGARTSVMSVSRMISAVNIWRPISAEAENDAAEAAVKVRSASASIIQAKPATSSRWIVRITNARRPRIRPRSSLTPTAAMPVPTSRSAPNRRRLPRHDRGVMPTPPPGPGPGP